MVRQGSVVRTSCARAGAQAVAVAASQTTMVDRRRRRSFRTAAARPMDLARPAECSGARRREAILQPGCWNDEQRREKEAEQRVQPDQRDVEATQAETNPECPQRTVCLQTYAPGRTSFEASRRIVNRDEPEVVPSALMVGKYSRAQTAIPGRSLRDPLSCMVCYTDAIAFR